MISLTRNTFGVCFISHEICRRLRQLATSAKLVNTLAREQYFLKLGFWSSSPSNLIITDLHERLR